MTAIFCSITFCRSESFFNHAKGNRTVFAAVGNFKAESFKFRVPRMLLHDDAKFCNATSLTNNFFSQRAGVGKRANRIKSRTLLNRAAKHRVEINNVKRIVRAGLQIFFAIGVNDFDATPLKCADCLRKNFSSRN